MGGAADAGHLPSPSGDGVEVWHNAESVFSDIWGEIEGAMRSAEAAHEGRAADAANASMEKMRPNFDGAKANCADAASGLEQQAGFQKEAFTALPKEGESLENGRPVQIDPPQKGWVEDWGLDDNALTGWMSDYEERQEDFTSTNDRAVMVMERYDSQTQGVIDGLPRDELPRDEQPPPPPPSQKPANSTYQSADSQFGNSTMSTPSTPASSSSSWASSTPTATPSAAAPSPGGVPAGSGSAWATPTPTPGASTGTPPGTVRGPDGTLYRQDPKTGQWMRQNPYNGRWAVAPNGPGGAGGAGGAGARGGMPGAGSGMGARGGMAGGGAGGASGGGQLGAGGRAGAGMPGGGAAGGGAAAGAGGGAGGAGGRGGGAAPMGGARGGGGGQGDEQEHDRPSWLLENDDVFTNDMDKVAPPVFGAPEEGQGR